LYGKLSDKLWFLRWALATPLPVIAQVGIYQAQRQIVVFTMDVNTHLMLSLVYQPFA